MFRRPVRGCPPQIIESWNKSEAILTLTNGSIIRGFSAEKPDRLRGPQCGGDELAAWLRLENTWDMAMMGLRLGDQIKSVFTTTPRPVPKVIDLLKSAETDPGAVIVRGTTYDNRANLSEVFFEKIVSQYEGTTLGRQEIYAEVIDPEEQGVVKRSWWRLWPAAEKGLPPFSFIIMSIDTAYSEHDRNKKTGETDFSACTVWGLFDDPDHPRREALMLLDAWQDKLGFPELLEKVKKEKEVAYGERTQPLPHPKSQRGPLADPMRPAP